MKTFTVDEGKSVSDITQEIGEKVGIKNPEEFSLQLLKEEENDGKYSSSYSPYSPSFIVMVTII